MNIKEAITKSIYLRGRRWSNNIVPPPPSSLSAGQLKLWNFLSRQNFKLSDNETAELKEVIYQATGIMPEPIPNEDVEIPAGVIAYIEDKREPTLSIPRGMMVSASGSRMFSHNTFNFRNVKVATLEEVEWYVNSYAHTDHLLFALDLIPEHEQYVRDVQYQSSLELTREYFDKVRAPEYFRYIRSQGLATDVINLGKRFPVLSFDIKELEDYIYRDFPVPSRGVVAMREGVSRIFLSGLKYATFARSDELSMSALDTLDEPSPEQMYELIYSMPAGWLLDKPTAELLFMEDVYEQYLSIR